MVWTYSIVHSLNGNKDEVVLQDVPLRLLVTRSIGEKVCELTGHRFCMTNPISWAIGLGYDSKYDKTRVEISRDKLAELDSIWAENDDEDDEEVTERGA